MPDLANNLPPRNNRDPAAKQRFHLRSPTRTGWGLALLILLSLLIFSHWFNEDRSEIDFGFFHDQLKAHNIQSLDVRGQTAYGEFKVAPLALVPVTPNPSVADH